MIVIVGSWAHEHGVSVKLLGGGFVVLSCQAAWLPDGFVVDSVVGLLGGCCRAARQ